MTTSQITQIPVRRRRTALGLVFASVVLGSTLTACGGDPGDTTCGEYKDKSDDDRIELIQDAIDDEDDDEAKEAFDKFSDDQKKTFADAIETACENEDDDTKLDDIDDL